MSAMEEEPGEAPCVSLRRAWWQHVKQLFFATLCATSVCVGFNAGVANLYLWAGRQAIEQTGTAVPFNIYAWNDEMKTALHRSEGFLVLYIVRDLILGITFTALQFYLPLYFIDTDPFSTRLVRGLWAFVAVSATVSFLAFDVMQLKGVLNISFGCSQAIGLAIDCVFFCPVLLFTYVWWFPRSKWLSVGGQLVLGVTSALTAYFAWRVLCYTFFRIQSRVLRVAVAVVAPPVLFNVGFESFFPISLALSEKVGIDTGACLLMSMMCFGLSMSNVLQLASPDFWTGFCIDLFAVATELKMKHCLVRGVSPAKASWRFLRSVVAGGAAVLLPCGHRSKGSARVITGVMDPAPAAEAAPAWPEEADAGSQAALGACQIGRATNQPMTGASSSSLQLPQQPIGRATNQPMTGASSSSLQLPQQPTATMCSEHRRAFRKELLRHVAVNSNLPELVTQMTVASYLLIANLNPNQVSGEPLNVELMMALLGTKLALELCVDYLTVHMAARVAEEDYGEKLHAATHSKSSLVILSCTACLWVTESLFLVSMTYCAHPDEDGNLKSLGLCDVKDLS